MGKKGYSGIDERDYRLGVGWGGVRGNGEVIFIGGLGLSFKFEVFWTKGIV